MRKLFGLLALILILNSCSQRVLVIDSKPKKAPPGQIKKVTGSQSAAPYAPGQQKKKH